MVGGCIDAGVGLDNAGRRHRAERGATAERRGPERERRGQAWLIA